MWLFVLLLILVLLFGGLGLLVKGLTWLLVIAAIIAVVDLIMWLLRDRSSL